MSYYLPPSQSAGEPARDMPSLSHAGLVPLPPFRWHPDRHQPPACPLLPVGDQRASEHRLLPFALLDLCPQLKRLIQWRRRQIAHVEPAGDAPDSRLARHLPPLFSIVVGNGRADTVAIDDSGDDAAIEDVLGPGGEPVPRLPPADRLRPVPVALDLQSVLIERSAAPALVARDLVLKGDVCLLRCHRPGTSCSMISAAARRISSRLAYMRPRVGVSLTPLQYLT